MLSICTINVTSVLPYPYLWNIQNRFSRSFFLDFFLGLYATFLTVYWNAVEDCGKKSVSFMKVALLQISDSLLKFLPKQFYLVKNDYNIWTLILFFMHECLANKKHIANIFCCYLDQGPTINQSAIDQSKYRVGRYSYFVMRFVGRTLAQDW